MYPGKLQNSRQRAQLLEDQKVNALRQDWKIGKKAFVKSHSVIFILGKIILITNITLYK